MTLKLNEVITKSPIYDFIKLNSIKLIYVHITFSAKLHALLNSSHLASQPPPQLSKPVLSTGNTWDINDEGQSEDSRRSNAAQPPPAHQQARAPAIPFDLKYTVPGKPTIIPGTSSTLTPIDLSAG